VFDVVMAASRPLDVKFQAVFPKADLAKGTRKIAEKMAVTIIIFQ